MRQPARFVAPDSPDWELLWERLAGAPINAGIRDPYACIHPESGEVWQYMGPSTPEISRGSDVHCFRHRHHPLTGKREYLHFGPDGFMRRTTIPNGATS